MTVRDEDNTKPSQEEAERVFTARQEAAIRKIVADTFYQILLRAASPAKFLDETRQKEAGDGGH